MAAKDIYHDQARKALENDGWTITDDPYGLDRYRDIIERVLSKHVFNSERYPHLRDRPVFDRRSDNYLVVREGWDRSERSYGVVVHLEIIDGKIWVQEDWTEHGVAGDLEEAGVPKDDIVLGFQPPHMRPYTEYAAV